MTEVWERALSALYGSAGRRIRFAIDIAQTPPTLTIYRASAEWGEVRDTVELGHQAFAQTPWHKECPLGFTNNTQVYCKNSDCFQPACTPCRTRRVYKQVASHINITQMSVTFDNTVISADPYDGLDLVKKDVYCNV